MIGHRTLVGAFSLTAIAALSGIAVAVAPATAQQEALKLKGTCGNNNAPRPGLSGLAQCRYVILNRDGANSSIVYLDRRERLSVRFDGAFTGDEMVVRTMQASGHDEREAEGKCWLTRGNRDSEITWVSCAAMSSAPGSTTYAAYFNHRGW